LGCVRLEGGEKSPNVRLRRACVLKRRRRGGSDLNAPRVTGFKEAKDKIRVEKRNKLLGMK